MESFLFRTDWLSINQTNQKRTQLKRIFKINLLFISSNKCKLWFKRMRATNESVKRTPCHRKTSWFHHQLWNIQMKSNSKPMSKATGCWKNKKIKKRNRQKPKNDECSHHQFECWLVDEVHISMATYISLCVCVY